MRAVLVHNETAGSDIHTDGQLVELVRRAGHRVEAVVPDADSLTATLPAHPCDFVIVAGGDGTVGRVTRSLRGSGIPLAILPLGTANNTALTLRLHDDLQALSQSWSDARRRPFDLVAIGEGSASGYVSEAVGWGIFPSVITVVKHTAAKEEGTSLDLSRELFQSMAQSLQPRRYAIEVDGKDHSGDYLMVEVMNVPFIGPQLEVSPASDPSDGAIELVLGTDAHRGAIQAMARDDKSTRNDLTVVAARRIVIRCSDETHHRDGELLHHTARPSEYVFTVEPAAVDYLVP
jgi:diacylglycerol kinase family enzyme